MKPSAAVNRAAQQLGLLQIVAIFQALVLSINVLQRHFGHMLMPYNGQDAGIR